MLLLMPKIRCARKDNLVPQASFRIIHKESWQQLEQEIFNRGVLSRGLNPCISGSEEELLFSVHVTTHLSTLVGTNSSVRPTGSLRNGVLISKSLGVTAQSGFF